VQTVPLGAIVGSSIDGFCFQFSATVRWRLISNQGPIPHAELSALAKDAVLQRAVAITSSFAPTDHVLAQHRVAAALGVEESDERRLVQVSAVDVNLAISEDESEAVSARRVRFAHEFANLAADFHPATADRIRRLFGLHVVSADEPDEDVPPPAAPVT
jgi:hypothetical protein